MSIFKPKWMTPEPFYPIWMGDVEIEITVKGRGVGSGDFTSSIEYDSIKKITMLVSKISITQNKTIEVKPNFEFKELKKFKVLPEVTINDVNFIKND